MPAASLSSSSISSSSTYPARDRVLDAALELFATHGFHAIGLRDLAGHLGMRAGSLYHHIENKQGLLFELIESALSDLLFSTRRTLKHRKTQAERLQGFVQAFVTFSLDDRDRLKLLTRDAVYLSAEHGALIDALKDDYTRLLMGIIAAQMNPQRPSSPAHLRLIASAVVGMLFGHAHWLAQDLSRAQLSQTLSRFVLGIIETGRSA